MRSAFDFTPYRRSTVGFDRLFDMLEHGEGSNGGENYPPFDLVRAGENDYRIELAVAGFKSDEIDITAQQNVLIVSGKKGEESESRGHVAVHPHHAFVTPALVHAAHAAGLVVNTWTCDDPDRIRWLAAIGVDGIVTNVPDVARAALAAPVRH